MERMADSPGSLATTLFLASAVIGVVAAERGWRRCLWWAKPVTTLLLFAVLGPAIGDGGFAGWIAAGVALSVVGDTALLFETERSFMFGLVAFLGAHGLYTVAFLTMSKAANGAAVGLYAAAMGAVTVVLLGRLWRGAGSLRIPVIIYGAAIATMAVSAFATISGGGLGPAASRLAALGALLFFVSDACLALSKFSKPIRHSAVLTLGVYWLGQLGIAWAARLTHGG
jgi:uncharacterized membrane protein YhhN